MSDEELKVLARDSDPETSHEAADLMMPRTIVDKIWRSLALKPGQTSREIAMDIGMAAELPSISPRLPRMEEAGLIRRVTTTGHILTEELLLVEGVIVKTKANPKTKRQAIMWEVVPSVEE